MSVTVHEATAARWDDLVTVFGTRGDPATCWCQFFVDPQWRAGRDANREELHRQVGTDDPPAGLVAYLDGEPVGWVQVGPYARYPNLARKATAAPGHPAGDDKPSGETEPDGGRSAPEGERAPAGSAIPAGSGRSALDGEPHKGGSITGGRLGSLWLITCFVVPPRHRRRGVAKALLAGAVEHARRQGASSLRAFPVDTSEGKRPGSDLYTGVLSTFLAAGFHEVSRRGRKVTVDLDLGS